MKKISCHHEKEKYKSKINKNINPSLIRYILKKEFQLFEKKSKFLLYFFINLMIFFKNELLN